MATSPLIWLWSAIILNAAGESINVKRGCMRLGRQESALDLDSRGFRRRFGIEASYRQVHQAKGNSAML